MNRLEQTLPANIVKAEPLGTKINGNPPPFMLAQALAKPKAITLPAADYFSSLQEDDGLAGSIEEFLSELLEKIAAGTVKAEEVNGLEKKLGYGNALAFLAYSYRSVVNAPPAALSAQLLKHELERLATKSAYYLNQNDLAHLDFQESDETLTAFAAQLKVQTPKIKTSGIFARQRIITAVALSALVLVTAGLYYTFLTIGPPPKPEPIKFPFFEGALSAWNYFSTTQKVTGAALASFSVIVLYCVQRAKEESEDTTKQYFDDIKESQNHSQAQADLLTPSKVPVLSQEPGEPAKEEDRRVKDYQELKPFQTELSVYANMTLNQFINTLNNDIIGRQLKPKLLDALLQILSKDMSSIKHNEFKWLKEQKLRKKQAIALLSCRYSDWNLSKDITPLYYPEILSKALPVLVKLLSSSEIDALFAPNNAASPLENPECVLELLETKGGTQILQRLVDKMIPQTSQRIFKQLFINLDLIQKSKPELAAQIADHFISYQGKVHFVLNIKEQPTKEELASTPAFSVEDTPSPQKWLPKKINVIETNDEPSMTSPSRESSPSSQLPKLLTN